MATLPCRRTWKCLAAFSLACLASASATSYQVAVDWLANSAGNGVSNGSLVFFVVDLNGNGLADPTPTDFTPGLDDAIIGTLNMDNFGGLLNQGAGASQFSLTLGSTFADAVGQLDAGDPLWLLWFPELTEAAFKNNTLTQPGAATYGKFTSTTAISGGQAWVVDSNPTATIPLQVASSARGNLNVPEGGDVPLNTLSAKFTTAPIPEPSVTLLAAAALALAARRRR